MGGRPVEWEEEGGRVVLRPGEAIDRSRVRRLWAAAERLLREKPPARLVLDLSGVARIDGAGVALVRELEDRCRQAGVDFTAEGASPAAAEFLDFVRGRSPERRREAPARRRTVAARLFQAMGGWARSLRELLELVGRFAESAAFLATHPHRLRLGDVLRQVQAAGAEGMWLVCALSVLLGIIMAFQGLGGARGFGSPILVADIVTISTTREMAPLLTGVIVTGRSAAAIAAEIGTMKIDEELDALSVMGFDVMRFLLVPRTLGLVISTPLLTLLSIAAGVVGGATVAVSVLHLSPLNYFSEVQKVLSAAQIASALAKGATFGLLIGVMACFRGLQARKAAEDVGKQTTAAVVSSILLIIVADAFYSIVSEVYGW